MCLIKGLIGVVWPLVHFGGWVFDAALLYFFEEAFGFFWTHGSKRHPTLGSFPVCFEFESCFVMVAAGVEVPVDFDSFGGCFWGEEVEALDFCLSDLVGFFWVRCGCGEKLAQVVWVFEAWEKVF